MGQLQLLQLLLTIGWVVLFLSEPLTLATSLTAVLVLLCVAVGNAAVYDTPLSSNRQQTWYRLILVWLPE